MALTERPTWASHALDEGPDGPPPGLPAPPPHRSLASPAAQGLVALAVVIAFAGLGLRVGSTPWFALPTIALLIGVAIGVQPDARRWFTVVPGVAWALGTFVVLSVVWVLMATSAEVLLTFAPVPLISLVVFGADWAWVERLRPTVVASGLGLIPLLDESLDAALPLAFAWCVTTAAALWVLRQDAARALPAPGPLTGSPGVPAETGAGRAVAGLAASWVAAAAIVALVGLVIGSYDSPEIDGRIDGSIDGRLPSDQLPSGGPTSIGPGGSGGGDADGDGIPDVQEGIAPGESGTDVDGDGIPDRDIDGDGVPDVDLDGDGIPDIDRDGDGVPDRGTEVDGPEGGGASDDGRASTPDPDGSDTGGASDGVVGRDDVARVIGVLAVALIVVALVAVAVRALVRLAERRRALAARPWAIRLAERLDREGADRGRARRRDEPVSRYAAALGDDVLAHDRMGDLGVALSAALFGPTAPSEATGEWARQVLDEAVAANPRPTWRDRTSRSR